MSLEHDSSPERAERQARWANLTAEIDEMGDKLGLGIDEEIKEAVIGLQAHGLETAQSCEGHDDHGDALPFVLVAVEKEDGWEESEAGKREMTAANTAQVEKLQTMLDEWYRSREEEGEIVSPEQRLVLKPRGIFGVADLQSASQERLSALPEAERKIQAPDFRDEMQKFSAYLKERFLSGFSS